jgi:hypothetical protein
MPNILDIIEFAISKSHAAFEIATRLGNSKLRLEISDLELALSSLKSAIAQLNEENLQLKTKLHEKTTNPLTLSDGIYYDREGRAFCPACYGSEEKRIPMSKANEIGAWILYECPKCSAKISKGSPPQIDIPAWNPLDFTS